MPRRLKEMMGWEKLVGLKARGDYYDPKTWEVFLVAGKVMDQSIVDRLDILGLAEAEAELQGLPISEPADQWVGWGTHRSAVAKLVLRPGSGELRVNGQPVWDYFNEAPEKARIFLLRLLSTDIARQVLSGMEAVVVVRGSSPTTMQQAKSVAHALANALVAYDSECSDPLNRAGFGGRRIKYKEKF